VTNGSTNLSCKPIDGYEQCELVDVSPVIDLTGLFVKAIAFAEPKVEITASDRTIGAFVARCFEAGDIGELCLASDGVLLSTILEDAKITVARLDDRFQEDTFDVTVPNRRVPTTTTTAATTTQPAG
jgi:hypothetical protein